MISAVLSHSQGKKEKLRRKKICELKKKRSGKVGRVENLRNFFYHFNSLTRSHGSHDQMDLNYTLDVYVSCDYLLLKELIKTLPSPITQKTL